MGATFYSDVVIVGSGLAGLYTALNLDEGLNILIISKGKAVENSSGLAQGGIAACIKENDSFDSHIHDTLLAGCGINDERAVNILVSEAPENIEQLIKLGVEFDRDSKGSLKTTLEGGHSRARVLHAGGDITGKKIMEALRNRIKRRDNITLLENTMAVDVIKEGKKCVGIKTLIENKLINIFSKFTVLATGGIGALFKYSTNPSVATGDGIAVAYRAGCELANMEFIQFHPTALFTRKEGKMFLISEAVRGEGAYLKNIYKERFMNKIHHRGELAPRDIVSQAIYEQMKKTGSRYVYLDITHRDKKFLKGRFPNIYRKCMEYGLDMSKDLIPVVPVEHYFIGGIKTDIYGRTNIENLYACGECANTGVHGANRLASNSLLECIVFGRRIANHINANRARVKNLDISKGKTIEIKEKNNVVNVEAERNIIKDTMDNYVGISRNFNNLTKAYRIIEEVLRKLTEKSVYTVDYLEAVNMAVTAKLIIKSCLKEKESIGCHKIEN
jgi:L-aspartate oxidase